MTNKITKLIDFVLYILDLPLDPYLVKIISLESCFSCSCLYEDLKEILPLPHDRSSINRSSGKRTLRGHPGTIKITENLVLNFCV